METGNLLLLSILLVGIVLADENQANVNVSPEELALPNANNEYLEDQSTTTQNLEVIKVNPNDPGIDKEDAQEKADDNSNVTNSEKTNNKLDEVDSNEGWEFENKTPVDTRRILNGKKVERGSRPYMVYLELSVKSTRTRLRDSLCGGVIIHREYVLTSAVCVEKMDMMYVIAGTGRRSKNKRIENDCARKNKRKVIWKCIPKNYKNDEIYGSDWTAIDMAIVKVDRPFNLENVEEGCQYAAKVVAYNNVSRELEEPGTKGFILGWGQGEDAKENQYRKYNDDYYENRDYKDDSYQCLKEAKVCLMDKDQCANKYHERLRNVIKQYMICTKDIRPEMSRICNEKYASCINVPTRRDLAGNQTGDGNQTVVLPEDVDEHLRSNITRRSSNIGGFCQDDYGGPLVVKYMNRDHVVGVMSAHQSDEVGNKCQGPFLYTSVFECRQFLACAIHKDVDDSDCRRVFRTGITHEAWTVDWKDE